jgi:hypothetical protein
MATCARAVESIPVISGVNLGAVLEGCLPWCDAGRAPDLANLVKYLDVCVLRIRCDVEQKSRGHWHPPWQEPVLNMQ